jgi:alanyl-tRNA synthetase
MGHDVKMTGTHLRRMFLDYFVSKGHTSVRSSSLAPANDPTLLFTNAGMVQFKDVFLGQENRQYKRAVSAQKCLRVSGKHNDLESVGRTARHHTFFEMLGNFSFGDYFKEKAVEYAWDFIVNHARLPVDRLYVTVYKDDDEAADIWEKRIGLPPGRVYRLGEKDNFWSMGDAGPCGPCSEIHYDRGPEHSCGKPDCGVACDCDRFLELWNLVFMQYNRGSNGKLTPLPNPSIDTGMGLERLVSVVQGKGNNFDTDLILPVILHMERLTDVKYPSHPDTDVSFRVIGDHARAVTFLVADDISPSNEGRGYVLRRILRRALRHGRLLGVKEPFLHKLTDTVIEVMKEAYPEIVNYSRVIRQVTLSEEQGFSATLEHGMNLIAEMMENAKAKTGGVIAGPEAFRLYDTYGFPMDLAAEITREAGVSIDMDGFNGYMKTQREKARASWKGAREGDSSRPEYKTALSGVAPTVFMGYENPIAKTKVVALIRGGAPISSASAGEEVDIALANTPFYAESGGQSSDIGMIYHNSFRAEVTDVSTVGGVHWVHKAKVDLGTVNVGDTVTAKIDGARRNDIRRNHSATHLLHTALRQSLGAHVKQAGSQVTPDRLRFDYSHFTAPGGDELSRIERMVNEKIMENITVKTEVKSLEDAAQSGATALFGEKYGENVRVVSMGDFSRELCGGTHVEATGDIGFFKIISEGGVAAGSRRLEAVTGRGAWEFTRKLTEELTEIGVALKSPPVDLADKARKNMDRIRELEKENRKLKERLFSGKSAPESETKDAGGVRVIAEKLDEADEESLRSFVDNARNRLGSGVVVAGTVKDGRALVAVGVSADLAGKIHAGKLVKEIAAIVGGGGGGRPDFAQAGGKNPEKLQDALDAVPSIVSAMAGKS